MSIKTPESKLARRARKMTQYNFKSPQEAAQYILKVEDEIVRQVIKMAEACEVMRMTRTDTRNAFIEAIRFSRPKFAKMTKIARSAENWNVSLLPSLPTEWSVLYEVALFTPDEIERALREGVLHRHATRAELEAFRGGRRERLQISRAIWPLR